MAGERRHGPAGSRLLLCDELDEPGHQRQSLLLIGRTRGIARLPKTRHVPDHRDRSNAVIATLQAPRRDRRVVDGAVQREVELHVPLQAVDSGTAPADAQVRGQLVRDRVRDHVPVAGWRLGVRTVRPELDDRAVVIALPHDVRGVRATRDGIRRMTVTIVRPQIVGADRTRRNVHHRVARCIEEAAVTEHLDGLRPVERVGGRVTQTRRRPGIDGRARCAACGNGEGSHMAPVRRDGLLNAVRQHDAVLAEHARDLERLPSVRVDQRDPRFRYDKRRIDRRIAGIGVPVRLVRAVRLPVIEHRLRDPVADRSR